MSRQAVTRITPPRGDTCKLEQPRPWYAAVLCFGVTKSTQRDQIAFVQPSLVVLDQRYDMVYRQTAISKYPRRKTYSAAMEIAFENCFSSTLPNLCVSELIRLGIALDVYIPALTVSLMDFPACGTVSFYLKFHTTIIPHLKRTKRTTL